MVLLNYRHLGKTKYFCFPSDDATFLSTLWKAGKRIGLASNIWAVYNNMSGAVDRSYCTVKETDKKETNKTCAKSNQFCINVLGSSSGSVQVFDLSVGLMVREFNLHSAPVRYCIHGALYFTPYIW